MNKRLKIQSFKNLQEELTLNKSNISSDGTQLLDLDLNLFTLKF